MSERQIPATGPQPPRVYTARGRVDGEDWAGVANALNERMATLRLGQQELAQRSGVSVSTLRQLQHGAGRRVQNKTLAAISTALEWPADHLTAVLLARRSEPPSTRVVDVDSILDGLRRIEECLARVTDRLNDLETLVRTLTR
jgi:DNA-binding Xre family transcriptional regulator